MMLEALLEADRLAQLEQLVAALGALQAVEECSELGAGIESVLVGDEREAVVDRQDDPTQRTVVLGLEVVEPRHHAVPRAAFGDGVGELLIEAALVLKPAL